MLKNYADLDISPRGLKIEITPANSSRKNFHFPHFDLRPMPDQNSILSAKRERAKRDSDRHKANYAATKAANKAERERRKAEEKQRKEEAKQRKRMANEEKLEQRNTEKLIKEQERNVLRLVAEEAAKLRQHPNGLAGLSISQTERDQKISELDTGLVQKVHRPLLPLSDSVGVTLDSGQQENEEDG
jgi:hypothetical protein